MVDDSYYRSVLERLEKKLDKISDKVSEFPKSCAETRININKNISQNTTDAKINKNSIKKLWIFVSSALAVLFGAAIKVIFKVG